MKETFGTITRTVAFNGDVWKIECVPHVMMMLKRIFKGYVQDHKNFTYIEDTEENALTLEWFLVRYPMKVTGAARMKKRAQACRAREARVQKILAPDYAPPEATAMALPAREYQRLAGHMLIENGALLLADDLGVGKTVSAICALAMEPKALPALVVTLTHLPKQWAREIAKFTPHLRTLVIENGPPYDITAPKKKRGAPPPVLGMPDVVILNNHKLARWRDHLAGKFRTVIFDEAQELRHPDSQKYAAARAVREKTGFAMGLTGTPIANYGGEIQHVVDVLKPGCLGTRGEFLREWCNSGRHDVVGNPEALGSHLRTMGLLLRRTRKDVGRELPPLSLVEHTVDHDPNALDAVGDRVVELAKLILSTDKLEKGARFEAGNEISYKLRMATGIAKAPYVAAFVRMLVESGEPVVLYGWHREVYSIWLDLLADLNPVMFTGSESGKQKEASLDAFMTGKTKLLIMSIRAGAGLDGLQTVCRTTVHGELDWSPMFIEQPVGRVFRDGQKDPVTAYVLVAETGADPVMADVLGLKRFQLTGIRDPSGDMSATAPIDPEHIRRLAKSFLEQRKQRHADRREHHVDPEPPQVPHDRSDDIQVSV